MEKTRGTKRCFYFSKRLPCIYNPQEAAGCHWVLGSAHMWREIVAGTVSQRTQSGESRNVDSDFVSLWCGLRCRHQSYRPRPRHTDLLNKRPLTSRSLPKSRRGAWVKSKMSKGNGWESQRNAHSFLEVCWAKITNHTPLKQSNFVGFNDEFFGQFRKWTQFSGCI